MAGLKNSEGAGRLLGVWPLSVLAVGRVGRWLVTAAAFRFIPAVRGFRWRRRLLSSSVVVWWPACQPDFMSRLMRCVFLACAYVWRRLAWGCRHTFYTVVYLCVFRCRL